MHSNQTLMFRDALREVMAGEKIKRIAWGDKDEYILLKDEYLMVHKDGDQKEDFKTLLVHEADLFADDWIVL